MGAATLNVTCRALTAQEVGLVKPDLIGTEQGLVSYYTSKGGVSPTVPLVDKMNPTQMLNWYGFN